MFRIFIMIDFFINCFIIYERCTKISSLRDKKVVLQNAGQNMPTDRWVRVYVECE